MKIAYICAPVHTLGPGNRLGIWFSGCDKDCSGCISPEMKDVNYGIDYDVEVLSNLFSLQKTLHNLNGITISGGEPLLQANEIISWLKSVDVCDVLMYTGYSLEYVMEQEYYDELIKVVSVLITDPYIEELNDNLPLRGSSNQRINFFDNNVQNLYNNYLRKPRKVEEFIVSNNKHIVGIPTR